MATTSRPCLVLVRRFSYGTRCYTKGHDAPKLKSVRFGKLEARIERALPTKLKPLLHHEAGLKTIFFWAPSWKWVLILAGMADYTRPADKLSTRQSLALAVSGFIWARWSLVIIPKNWNLFSVNLFLGFTGCMQLARIYLHDRKMKHRGNKQPPETTRSDQIIQVLAPADGTRMVFAPGVKPKPGILGPLDIYESKDSKYESTSTQIKEEDVL